MVHQKSGPEIEREIEWMSEMSMNDLLGSLGKGP